MPFILPRQNSNRCRPTLASYTLHNRTVTTILWSSVACKVNASGDHMVMHGRVFFSNKFFKMDPRLKLAMIMLFFQAVQFKNKAVQLVMLELERVHQERGRNRGLELVEMARYFRFVYGERLYWQWTRVNTARPPEVVSRLC